MKTLRCAVVAAITAFTVSSNAAEYQGSDLDGETYSCTAFSYATGKYYYLTCEFDGDEVILHFPRGGRIRVTLDDEDIDDPSSISAYDYGKGTFWDLDVDLQGRGPVCIINHMPGLLRIVRGHLMLSASDVAALGRASFTATFNCDVKGLDDPLPLHDAHLVHADATRLVLSGDECVEDMARETHYA